MELIRFTNYMIDTLVAEHYLFNTLILNMSAVIYHYS